MKRQGMMRWDRTKNAYVDPQTGEVIGGPRIPWVAVAVQRAGGIARLEYESGYAREHIIQWIEQGYVNEPREARMLAVNSGLPQYYFPVGCDSNDV